MSKKHSSKRKSAKKIYQENKRARNAIAFFIFLAIASLSLLGCVKAYFINDSSLVNVFTNRAYVSALHEDILFYSLDLSDKCSIPRDAVEEAVTFDAVEDIEKAYVNANFLSSEDYTETSYLDKLDLLKESVTESTEAMLGELGIKADKKDIDEFAGKIADYAKKRAEFPYMTQLATLSNSGSVVVIAGIVVMAIIALLLILVLISVGKKLYKSLRAVSFSLIAAGTLDLLLALGVKIVGCFKSLVIYPVYLCDSIMNYINGCVISVCFAGAILLMAALVTISAVWRLKRSDNETK